MDMEEQARRTTHGSIAPLLAAALLLAASTVSAIEPVFSTSFGGAIRGYDPVAYFTQGRHGRGKARPSLRVEGRHLVLRQRGEPRRVRGGAGEVRPPLRRLLRLGGEPGAIPPPSFQRRGGSWTERSTSTTASRCGSNGRRISPATSRRRTSTGRASCANRLLRDPRPRQAAPVCLDDSVAHGFHGAGTHHPDVSRGDRSCSSRGDWQNQSPPSRRTGISGRLMIRTLQTEIRPVTGREFIVTPRCLTHRNSALSARAALSWTAATAAWAASMPEMPAPRMTTRFPRPRNRATGRAWTHWATFDTQHPEGVHGAVDGPPPRPPRRWTEGTGASSWACASWADPSCKSGHRSSWEADENYFATCRACRPVVARFAQIQLETLYGSVSLRTFPHPQPAPRGHGV